MVKGLSLFADRFEEFADSYIVIGGTACYLNLREAGLEFRATKDIDIVLLVESLTPAFFSAFWTFVKDGKYAYQQKSTGRHAFYRFYKPENMDYPYMLELFSRLPDFPDYKSKGHLTPIPSGAEASSLSAILLDPDYYRFLLSGVVRIDGISIAKPEYLIPLKAKAWIDLTNEKEKGEHVDSKDIQKHAKDIATLFSIVAPDDSISLEGGIALDFSVFLTKASEVLPKIAELSKEMSQFYQIKIEGN